MHLYILRWNPNISSYKTEHHLDLITHIKKDEQPTDFNWSIYEYENLSKDDMFIVQQVGTKNDGIAMIGKFKNACYEDDSWRNDGSKLHYADMWIMDAFDCDNENPLPAKRYEELFPEIEWHGGHSGIIVEEDLDDKLITEIENDLIKANIWEKGELDKFMAWDFEKENAGKILMSVKNMYLKDKTKESFLNLVGCLLDSKVLIPMHVENDENDEKKCYPMILSNDDNESAYPIFSNEEQLEGHYEEPDCEVYEIPVTLAIEIIKEDKETKGLILDPFTTPFLIESELMELLLDIASQNESDDDSE